MVTPLRRPSFVPAFVLTAFVCLFGIHNASALNFQTLYKFPAPPRSPDSPLAVGRDGSFYGITTAGGTNDSGTIFKITPSGTYKHLLSFGEGFRVNGGLVFGADGNLYGTTTATSTNQGSIFRVTTNGLLKVMVQFKTNSAFGYPQGLLLGKDKNYYFTAFGTNSGVFARMTPLGVVTVVATNNLVSGVSMMQGRDGHFYGLAPANINHNETVFKETAKGVSSVVYDFGSVDSANAFQGPLVQKSSGVLYGMNITGGDLDHGTLFKVTTNGTFTSLSSLPSAPTSPLLVLNDVLYGATATNIFKVLANDEVTNFVSFDSSIEITGMSFGRDGNLYCTAVHGGTNNSGAIIRVTPAGVVTDWKTFDASLGSSPEAEMALGDDGFLYGTTSKGGTNETGTIFQASGDGLFSSLLSFDGSDNPHDSGLMQAADGAFYGTTSASLQNRDGSVFRFISGNPLETIAAFDGTNGMLPAATMVQGADGRLYGVTKSGGGVNGFFAPQPSIELQTITSVPVIPNSGRGTVFAVTTNGEITTLVRFDGTNGSTPSTKLVPGNDGNFYGTTLTGGGNFSPGLGTIFKVTPEGDLTTLVQFAGTNGANPSGLTLANDGNFYGTTSTGGKSNVGTIFRMTSDGALTTLLSFTKTNGENPHQIIQAGNGKLYGTTTAGGKYKKGTFYEFTTSGILTILNHFSGTNGAAPYAAVTELPDGSICGVTTKGGNGAGVIFRYGKVPPTIVTQPLSHTNALRSKVTFTVGVTGPTPYTYQWLKNGSPITKAIKASLTLTNLTYSSAGNYSVIVSNLDGFTVSSNAVLTIAAPPFIITQPESQTATVGTTVSFSVVANSQLPLAYQWQFKGVALPGKTRSTLTLTNIQTSKAGGYRVLVKNGSGSVLSSNAVLTVQTCSYTLSTNIIYIGSDGGSAGVSITANHGDCSWLTANTNSWITLTSATVNTGDANVTFNVSSNVNSNVRVGTILTAGTNFLVVQTGTPAPTTINGKTFTFRVEIGAGSDFQMTTALIGNTYKRLPAINVPNTYSYQRGSVTSATLTLTQAGVYQLTYETLTSGTYVYVATNSAVGTGTFAMTDAKPDYNGDGSADLLWQKTDGSFRVSLLNGTNYLGTIVLPTVVDSNWVVMGQGDFNGDGNFDLVMQSTSGFVAVHYMQGTNFLGSTLLNSGNAVDTLWHIAGVHDMNNDGKPDILWQSAGGVLWIWLMDGIVQTSSFVLRNGVTPGSAWKVVALADFNGDGQTDILFLHDTGFLAVWYMNGTTYLSGGILDINPLADIWKIRGSMDFDGDGQIDLLLENTSGELVVWQMNGVTRTGGFILQTSFADPAWRIVGPK